MQDNSQQNQNSLTIARLKTENAELKPANKELTERCEFFAHLVLDLQEQS